MNESSRHHRQLRRLVALASLILSAGCATSRSPAPAAAPPEDMHLFLLAGQSNMAGRGEVEAQDRAHVATIVSALSSAGFPVAEDPIHK